MIPALRHEILCECVVLGISFENVRRRQFPGVLRFTATRRFAAYLVGGPETRSLVWMRAAAWWLLTLLVLPLYVVVRSNADNIGLPVHGASTEHALFGALPTVWLQGALWNGSEWLEWAVVIVHTSWFFVPLALGLAISLRRPDRVGSYLRWWIAAELMALVFFILLPTRPPWMDNHEVVRVIALRFGGQIEDSNGLAAMPSLHVALPFVLALWLWRERWLAPAIVMLGYTSVIAFEVVFSGEHYAIDVIGAVAFGFLVAGVARQDMWKIAQQIVSWAGTSSRRWLPGKRSFSSERGQALIEMAFILPVMLVFLLVLVDFGLALDRREVIQHAAREGARYGAVGHSVDEIKDQTVAQSEGVLATSDVSVCYVDGTDSNTNVGDAGDDVQVSIDYTYGFSAGSGELLAAMGVGAPSIQMTPLAQARLETPVTGANACS